MAVITAPTRKAIYFFPIGVQSAQLILVAVAEWLHLFGSICQAKSHNIEERSIII